jgi:hypothetical protein
LEVPGYLLSFLGGDKFKMNFLGKNSTTMRMNFFAFLF